MGVASRNKIRRKICHHYVGLFLLPRHHANNKRWQTFSAGDLDHNFLKMNTDTHHCNNARGDRNKIYSHYVGLFCYLSTIQTSCTRDFRHFQPITLTMVTMATIGQGEPTLPCTHLLIWVGIMFMHGFRRKSHSHYNVSTLNQECDLLNCEKWKYYINIVMPLFASPLPPPCHCSNCHIHPSTLPRRPIHPALSFFHGGLLLLFIFLLQPNNWYLQKQNRHWFHAIQFCFFSLSPKLVSFNSFSLSMITFNLFCFCQLSPPLPLAIPAISTVTSIHFSTMHWLTFLFQNFLRLCFQWNYCLPQLLILLHLHNFLLPWRHF